MKLLEKHFDLAFTAPNGVQKLRELILTFAMQGKLVPQDPNDQPASELLKAIEAEKQRLAQTEEIKISKPLLEIKIDEIPYELPKGWKWVRLGSIAAYIQRGIGPRYSDIPEIPVISQKCIQWSGFNKSIVKFIDPSTIDRYRNERFIRDGDLLWNSTGTGTIGRINVYRDELNEFKRVVADSHVTVIRLIGLCNAYVLNFLMSPIVQKHIEENASGTTNQIELNTTTVINQVVPLPPLAEQRRIVAKIDRLMARCDELEKLRGDRNQKRITIHTAALDRLLTAKESNDFSTAWRFITQHFGELYSVKENVAELRKAILQLAVMGKLVPQDPTDEPASELLKAIEAEKQRLVKKGKIKAQKPLPKISQEEIPYALPEGWKWVRMDDLCIGITSGSTPPNNIFSDKEGIPFLKVYNIRNQKIDFQYKPQFINEEYHLKSKRSCLNPGDVIMNIVGPPLGKVAIIPNHFPEYNCNQAIVFFRPVIKSLNEYLYLYLLSGKFLDKIELIGTAGQDNISVTKSRSILIPLAPLSEQLRIIKKTGFLMDLCDRLEKQIDAATSKRTELLKALMAQV